MSESIERALAALDSKDLGERIAALETLRAAGHTAVLPRLQTYLDGLRASRVGDYLHALEITVAALSAPAAPAYNVRRAAAKDSGPIADLIQRVSGKAISRQDVLGSFAEKSYSVAENTDGTLVGVMSWRVENMINWSDEVYLDPSLAPQPLIDALTATIEEQSKELKSEVTFIIPSPTMQDEWFVNAGYKRLTLDNIVGPVWTEAVKKTIGAGKPFLGKTTARDKIAQSDGRFSLRGSFNV